MFAPQFLPASFLLLAFFAALTTLRAAEHAWSFTDGSDVIAEMVTVQEEGLTLRQQTGEEFSVAMSSVRTGRRLFAWRLRLAREICPPLGDLMIRSFALDGARIDEAARHLLDELAVTNPELEGITLTIRGGVPPIILPLRLGKLPAVRVLDLLTFVHDYDWYYEKDQIVIGPIETIRNLRGYREKQRTIQSYARFIDPLEAELLKDVHIITSPPPR